MNRPSAIEALRIQVEMEGHAPGTRTFDRVLRRRQLARCQEMRSTICPECPHNDECSLLQAWLQDQREAEASR
jgi:hypothetical protein